jgi:heme-degrading monooxygenase HmoA
MIVVIFSAKMRADANLEEYGRWGERMYELVQQIPGFISITSYPEGDRGEVTIVRFTSEEALKAWRTQPEHLQAQQLGRSTFYESYWIQVCKTVRDYEFHQDTGVTHREPGKDEEPLRSSS